MQNTNQYGSQQPYGTPANGLYQSAPAEQAMPPKMHDYQEENWLEMEQSKKRRPVLKALGLVVFLVGLFCMSTLAGMMSDGKRPLVALFKNNGSGNAEVKGESTTVQSPQYSGLSVGRASEVGQADATNDNHETLTSRDPFYQYFDTLKGRQITVARQPLPDDFNGNPAALQKLAANIGANQTFSTDKWGTAYMLVAPDAQVVVIANNRTLVFLRSIQQYSKEDWKGYIDTFQLR